MRSEEAVLILSGGVDSVTLLHYLLARGYVVHAVSFLYGQRHSKEIECAKYWAEKLCSSHRIYRLPRLSQKSALTNPNAKVPETHYSDESQRATVVPARNLVFISFAVALAEELGLKEVFYAAHYNDKAVYPDCREEFVEKISAATREGTYAGVEVRAPFVRMTKADIVNLGLKLGVDYSKTWTCYVGGERPCLKCGSCRERAEAFLLNKTKDPLLSDSEWRRAVEICRSCGGGDGV